MFYIINVIKVQWVTMVLISALCSQTQRLRLRIGCDKRQAAPERLLQTHATFSKSVMVSMGVFKLGLIDLIFIDARVKISCAYYCEVLLTLKLQPVMHEIGIFIFQQVWWEIRHRFCCKFLRQ